jgi:hypothetical protein
MVSLMLSSCRMRLALLLVLNAVLFGTVAVVAAPHGWEDSSLRHVLRFVSADGDADSWSPLDDADEYFRRGETAPIYSTILLGGQFKFQYPPTALLVYRPVRDAIGWTNVTPKRGLAALGIVLVAITGIASAAIFARLRQIPLMAGDIAISLLAAGTFYPLVKGVTLGQIQTWISAGFALALLAWISDRKVLSGMLIGLMSLVKPHYGLFALWALLRREWGFSAALLGVCAFGLALSIASFGLSHHLDYLNALNFLSRHGEAFYPNQSINGLLNRLMGYQSLEWEGTRFPPYKPIVYFGSVVAALVLLGIGIFYRAGNATISFCIMALTVTVASPIAWEHHYGLLLPIYAVALATMLEDGRALFCLGISYVLTSNFLSVTNWLAGTPFNILQSYTVFGALILLVLLCRQYAIPNVRTSRTRSVEPIAPAH